MATIDCPVPRTSTASSLPWKHRSSSMLAFPFRRSAEFARNGPELCYLDRVLRRLFSHEAHEPASFDVIVRGRPVEVAVRRNAAARRITLRVKNATGQVVLTLPKRASLVHGQDFASRQVDWIAD